MARHYIAYNNVQEWGPVVEAGPEFSHFTARRLTELEKTLGQDTWVISGESVGGKMAYRLCHVFRPEEIIRSGGGHILRGKGRAFVPHADVTDEGWFGKLLVEQNNFSHGVSEIKDKSVIDALLAFTGPPSRAGVPAKVARPQSDIAFTGPPSLADVPAEIVRPQSDIEGAARPVTANAYERDPEARAACIAHYGARCLVCGFDFEAQYGERGRGVMDVHQLKPPSQAGPGYQPNPIQDLRPVCHNCHTIIHKGTAPLTLTETRALVRVKYGRDRQAQAGRAPIDWDEQRS